MKSFAASLAFGSATAYVLSDAVDKYEVLSKQQDNASAVNGFSPI